MGDGFGGAVSILWILAVAYVVGLAQNAGYGLMLARDRHRLFAKIAILESVANVGLSILLAPRLGIIGVALGTAIPMLVVKVFVQPLYVSRVAGVSLAENLRAMLIPASVATGMTVVGMSAGLLPFLASRSLFVLIGTGVATGVAYVALVYALARKMPYMPELDLVRRLLNVGVRQTESTT